MGRRLPARPATTFRACVPRARRARRRRSGRDPCRPSLALARGEALQRRQRHDPATTVEGYLERRPEDGEALRGGVSSRRRAGDYGLLLGVAFQIVDDILDCAGDTLQTGKVPGHGPPRRTPTLPLLFAAERRRGRASGDRRGPLEGVLVRVAASGALERSREVALDYASSARESLDGASRRPELEALTDAVVERNT